MYAAGYEKIRTGNKEQYKKEDAGRLIVEQRTDKHQIDVAKVNAAPLLFADRCNNSKHRIDHGEECPEVKLREKQGTIGVEGKYVVQQVRRKRGVSYRLLVITLFVVCHYFAGITMLAVDCIRVEYCIRLCNRVRVDRYFRFRVAELIVSVACHERFGE